MFVSEKRVRDWDFAKGVLIVLLFVGIWPPT